MKLKVFSKALSQSNDFYVKSLSKQTPRKAIKIRSQQVILIFLDVEVAPCNGLPAEHVEEIDGLSSSRHLPNVDMTKSVAFAKLEAELASAQKELKLKEEEVTKLSKIREEVITTMDSFVTFVCNN
jgi:hypothetical protein